ncbi:MAG: hypothetical protein IKG89_03460 [Oscillospiraceae bacterium]|nr:hypothetical protein [Oscillospiraceae bacterium]
MKRVMALMFAMLLTLTFFSGCNNANPSASSDPEIIKATDLPSVTNSPTSEPDPESPYNFAAGKFKADANGLALEPYDYPLPLTTSDEVITIWTCNYTPQYLSEDGYDSMPLAQEVFKRTGVHVETTIVPSANRSENFAVLMASEALLDIMTTPAAFYSNPIEKAVLEEGWFANLYDYRMYLPNYIYEATKDPDDLNTIRKVFKQKDLICLMYELRKERELSSGAFARGDWLWEMGKTNADIKTFNDLHEMFTFFKVQKEVETPATLLSSLEISNAFEWVGYDTYCCCSVTNTQYVVDGQVHLSNLGENDRDLMTMIYQWYSEGLLDPNWTSYGSIPDIGDKIMTGQLGYIAGTRATTMKANESAIPEGAKYGWVAITKPQRYEGQTLHMGFQCDRPYWGSAGISTSCENIPLACTWLDWRYSDEGSFLYGYGVEGVSWEYDESGNVVITEFITESPAGWTMIMLTYALNSLCEPGLYINYAWNAPGNEVAIQYTKDWDSVPHDDLYVYPSGISYTLEQSERITSIVSDLSTYLQENYLSFVDGSKSLSDWDSYVQGAKSIGSDALTEIYQEAYEAFISG